MPDPAHKAVFLSYASQDAEVARRICDSLRAAGVEVWLDQSELVGGDAWDAKIRGQIGSCTLFVPVVSAGTKARREEYFRLEWKLADERTHLMAEGTPFFLPVVIDDTKDREALVPKSFLGVQWTRIGSADSLPAFCARVKTLLGAEVGARAASPAPRAPADKLSALPKWSSRPKVIPAHPHPRRRRPPRPLAAVEHLACANKVRPSRAHARGATAFGFGVRRRLGGGGRQIRGRARLRQHERGQGHGIFLRRHQ